MGRNDFIDLRLRGKRSVDGDKSWLGYVIWSVLFDVRSTFLTHCFQGMPYSLAILSQQ